MIVVERQVHGYRQGHQLLAASEQLPKEDQSVVDQLSDVAGPLRPRERFESYLTAYPLPSGDRFVLARTWQDLTVARAGCVRTLSLIIPIADWAVAEGMSSFFKLLKIDRLPDDGDAKQEVLSSISAEALPPVVGFAGSELLEALFLEEARPVVVLDAIDPDLIAIRLLTSLWPSLRRQFAVSTFALSPRKIAGRDFDLVFAPKDARAKFADWTGRRVDGRLSPSARHRWTGTIVERVFEQPYPRLLTSTEVRLVGGGESDIDNAAALRIALLWNELLAKLESTPTAVLGLLDIANSGKVRDALALEALEPLLAAAAHRAPVALPEAEAWSFLGAIARKMQGRTMPRGRAAVSEAVEQLAAKAPESAVALLSQEDRRGVVADLLPSIASGIGGMFTDRSERALLNADPDVFGRLLAEGGLLVRRVADDVPLIDRLGEVLPQLSAELVDAIGRDLLPVLTEDWQVPAAEPLLDRLDGHQLANELHRLGATNDFGAPRLAGIILDRALSAGAKHAVRSTLETLPSTERRDGLIEQTLESSVDDVRWLMNSGTLHADAASGMLLGLLRRADDQRLAAILSDQEVGEYAVRTLERGAFDLLLRAVSDSALPLSAFVRIVRRIFVTLDAEARLKLAKHALTRSLGSRFGDDEIAFLAAMLGAVGDHLDGAWVARLGLSKGIVAPLASRNMVAFHKAPQPARFRIVWSINEVAQILRDRGSLDLDSAALEACAKFMFDAEKVAPRALLAAAGYLLPTLLRSRSQPASLMIAAAFPALYREFAKEDDVPDLYKFIPFLDWDRCKAARHELVDAFMSSSWPPRDLALTACRANEVENILKWVAKQRGGQGYIKRLSTDIEALPQDCRKPVEKTIADIRSNWSSKYDWRD